MKTPLVLLILGLVAIGLRAEQPVGEQPVPPAAPKPSMMPAPGMHPMPGAGQQSILTPEEGKILGQARMQLQQDPEIVDLSNQIKVLMDKRAKLTEEKLQKINPEAAAILQKLKERQEKMMAERKAQMEATQAKMKAQMETPAATPEKPAFTPTPPLTTTPATPPAPASTP